MSKQIVYTTEELFEELEDQWSNEEKMQHCDYTGAKEFIERLEAKEQ